MRVIRKDLVARCGPLGGIYSALKTSRADAELFLACDMPFVSAELLNRVLWPGDGRRGAVFLAHDGRVGFPFLLPVPALAAVEEQIRQRRFSLRDLARRLRARLVSVPRGRGRELFNVNTPEDWRMARALFAGRDAAGATKACDGREAAAKNSA